MPVSGSFKTLILALFVALVAACSSPVSGVVVEKRYEPAYTYTQMVPQYMTRCDSKGVCTSYVAYYIPVEQYVPEKWSVQVREDDGDLRWAAVSEQQYNDLKNGNWFTNDPDRQPSNTF